MIVSLTVLEISGIVSLKVLENIVIVSLNILEISELEVYPIQTFSRRD